jgi:EF hand domain-containing protein
MSKKVVLVASLLVAAGAAAAISAPSLRGQRHGSLLADLTDGLGQATQHVSQAIGVSDEDAAPSREERKGRRAKQRRASEDRVADDAADPQESKAPREARGKGWRSKERLARQDDDDGGDAAEARRERRWVERDRGARDDDAGPQGRGGASAPQERSANYFARLDKNGDGAVDASEFVIAETERIAERARQFFKRFDADGDGKVTREEFNRGSRERFTAADPDSAGDAPQGARGRTEAK